MANAYHNVFFVARKGVADSEIIAAFNRFRDTAIERGYLADANDLSVGKVVLPEGGDDEELARARSMTGGYDWAVTVRLDGSDGLQTYIQKSPADIKQAGIFSCFTEPPQLLVHDHVNQS